LLRSGGCWTSWKPESSLIEFCKQDLSFYKFSAAFILVTRQDRRCYVYGLEHEGQVDPPRWSVFVKTGKKETVGQFSAVKTSILQWRHRLEVHFAPFSGLFLFSSCPLGVAWSS
jgi:hypothetical protein